MQMNYRAGIISISLILGLCGCQALIKDESLIEQIAQDIVSEEVQDFIPKK